MNSETTFSNVFWRKIKDQLRIQGIVQKKPKKSISLSGKDDEDLNIDLQKVCEWSQDNKEMYQLIKKNGFATFICNKQFISQHYKTITFQKQKIDKLDTGLQEFSNLHHLNIGFNKISRLENCPSNLIQLDASHNLIKQISLKGALQYLDVSYNNLNETNLPNIISSFQQLRHLNLGYNNICQIKKVQLLGYLKFLKSLVLIGNPISLLEHYYKTITNDISLVYFDNSKYIKQEKKIAPKLTQEVPPPLDNKEKKETKKETKKNTKKQTKKQTEPEVQVRPTTQQKKIINVNQSTFTLSLTVLSNLPSTVLEVQVCPNYEANPKEYLPYYWLQYQAPHGKISTKQRKIFFDSATIEQENAMITFSQIFKLTFEPTIELRDYFVKGSIVEIFSSFPKIVLDATTGQNKPMISGEGVVRQQKCLGVIHLNLEIFLKQTQKTLQYKYRLYPEEAKNELQFIFPLQDESDQLLKNQHKIDELQRNKEKLKQKQLQIQNSKKQSKKDPKKQDKKPIQKKGEKVESQNRVEPSPFPIFPRQYIFVSENKIIEATQLLLGVSCNIRS